MVGLGQVVEPLARQRAIQLPTPMDEARMGLRKGGMLVALRPMDVVHTIPVLVAILLLVHAILLVYAMA